MHSIITTPNGIDVNINLIDSEASRSIAKQPQLVGFIQEALKGRNLRGNDVRIEHDMGRSVGYDFVVDAAENADIFYAKILRDPIYSRFIKKGEPASTQYITVVLHRADDARSYEVQSVRIGRFVPPRPTTPYETDESKVFWTQHAIVQHDQVLQLRTITSDCPY